MAVADGLGGHAAGDVASATAIDALRQYDRAVEPDQLAGNLGHAVSDINAALRRQTTANPALARMGTTLVALAWSGSSAVVANVGDSRVYLLRAGALAQVTEDHVYGSLVSAASSVPNLPEKLARFLDGRTDGRSPDLTPIALKPGDRVLLCSDGLSSFVAHAVIENVLIDRTSADEVVDRLVQLALDAGGPDNVTAIIVDVEDSP